MAFSFGEPRIHTCSSLSMPRQLSMRSGELAQPPDRAIEEDPVQRGFHFRTPVSWNGGAILPPPIHIIGGGLAGSEAAWQVARRGLRAVLYEMRPARRTPAHQTGRLAELVCSNSLKSEQESTAPVAAEGGTAPPGFAAAARRRTRRACPAATRSPWIARSSPKRSRAAIAAEPLDRAAPRGSRAPFRDDGIVIVATGPLTSDALAAEIARLTGSGPAVLLRQHQPHRGRRHGGHRASRSGPRATANRPTAPTIT